MNILILDAYFRPEQTSYSHLEEDLLNAFLASGDHLRVLCPTPTRNVAEGATFAKEESQNGGALQIKRFWAPKEGGNPILRALRYFWCNLRYVAIAKKHQNVDLIFCNSTPPVLGLAAVKLKKKLEVPFVYNLQDIFPESLANTGLTKKGSLLWRMGLRSQLKIYRAADCIITIGEDFRQNLLSKGIESEKIHVIPNWVNTENVYTVPREENDLFDKYGLDRSLYYISYSGNLGHTQNLDLLLSVATKLKNEMPDLRFVLVGEGAEKERITERIKNEKIENIILLPFQDYQDIAKVFSLGDAGLLISKKGVGENSIPSKTFGYMAAERPILTSFDLDSRLSRLLETIGCGVLADGDDEDGLIRAILEIRKHPEIGKRGRRYLLENLSKDVCTKQYVDASHSVR